MGSGMGKMGEGRLAMGTYWGRKVLLDDSD